MQISHVFYTDRDRDVELALLLKKGWKVVHHAVTGNNNRWCFSYVLEMDPSQKDTSELVTEIGNARYQIKLAEKSGGAGWTIKAIKDLVDDFSKFVEHTADTLGVK